ncbi:DUF1996 domain-containing protein [Cellulomonas xylanilytica]|uniref:F5/8 type C domain-containing protein n=1 Tax=Cellulomonas xylanilytica TaxID=233583 RepID=A0A510V0E4_9CELL|nr:DUF1996 domain-containing protein [Cellulomonas xylanilytica]GEK20388.1 hypothetical protein CXY01_09080 [Cellulomonas xylanilytica]
MPTHLPAPRSRKARAWLAAALSAVLVATGLGVAVASSASAAPVNISQGKLATSSSAEGPDFTASKAVDGNGSTRWASQFSDAQWIQVDLGGTATVDRVELRWEAAYAKAFQVQLSPNGTTWTTVATVTNGTGGNQTVAAPGTGRYLRLNLTARGTGYGYSLWDLAVLGTGGGTTPPHTPKPLPPAPPGADTSVTHHEFQANCTPTHTLNDDPIVYPGQAGASHSHTFMGNRSTNANTTTASLLAANSTSCTVPQDESAYWFPTLLRGDNKVVAGTEQTIYYKAGIIDYKKVVPFPQGLRYLVGSMTATKEEFRTAPGAVEGFECGNSSFNWDIPASCPIGSQLNVRYQAPSCWDGVNLDSANHKSHMAYPVNGECTASHPVAVPMIEFKLSWPADGNMSDVRFSSGRGFSFHYDFFNAWDPAVLQALTEHCINGGLQCNPRGYDLYKPWAGAVLDASYTLIP